MPDESIRVSEAFYEFLTAKQREDEALEETLRRLVGGPRPADVADVLSAETADAIRQRLAEKREVDVAGKSDLRDAFE